MFNKQKLLIYGFILLVVSAVFFQNFKNKESVESNDQLNERLPLIANRKNPKTLFQKLIFLEELIQ